MSFPTWYMSNDLFQCNEISFRTRVIADAFHTHRVVKYCTSGCSVNLYQVSIDCVCNV